MCGGEGDMGEGRAEKVDKIRSIQGPEKRWETSSLWETLKDVNIARDVVRDITVQDTNFNFKGVVKGVEVLPQSVISPLAFVAFGAYLSSRL